MVNLQVGSYTRQHVHVIFWKVKLSEQELSPNPTQGGVWGDFFQKRKLMHPIMHKTYRFAEKIKFTPKLLEIEKEIVREVARSEHLLRICKSQSINQEGIGSAQLQRTDLKLCDFLR